MRVDTKEAIGRIQSMNRPFKDKEEQDSFMALLSAILAPPQASPSGEKVTTPVSTGGATLVSGSEVSVEMLLSHSGAKEVLPILEQMPAEELEQLARFALAELSTPQGEAVVRPELLPSEVMELTEQLVTLESLSDINPIDSSLELEPQLDLPPDTGLNVEIDSDALESPKELLPVGSPQTDATSSEPEIELNNPLSLLEASEDVGKAGDVTLSQYIENSGVHAEQSLTAPEAVSSTGREPAAPSILNTSPERDVLSSVNELVHAALEGRELILTADQAPAMTLPPDRSLTPEVDEVEAAQDIAFADNLNVTGALTGGGVGAQVPDQAPAQESQTENSPVAAHTQDTAYPPQGPTMASPTALEGLLTDSREERVHVSAPVAEAIQAPPIGGQQASSPTVPLPSLSETGAASLHTEIVSFSRNPDRPEIVLNLTPPDYGSVLVRAEGDAAGHVRVTLVVESAAIKSALLSQIPPANTNNTEVIVYTQDEYRDLDRREREESARQQGREQRRRQEQRERERNRVEFIV